MLSMSGSVTAHKNLVKSLIRGSELTLEIRLPVAITSTGVNPLYGSFTRETDTTGTTIGPIKCLWYEALSVRAMGQFNTTGVELTVQAMAGQYAEATAFAEIWLEDVLLDPTQPNEETWFDRAKEVLYGGRAFQILGTTRIGLPTVPPYIAVVALKGGVGYGA